ncbi:uncharacterized protein [Rutidosis leptorrhynchoides]|uniref:uncharacterized protein n=1 Tax=Rutidosis leptorrhynchoides TaxID=125765 RepID=UPI003A98D945
MNVWRKFGIEKTMMNFKGFFFFKFSTEKGLMDVLEHGPWIIRNIPIILNKWSPSVSLTKEDLTKVPLWVKLHDIPIVGFTEDGLSLIASKVGHPKMLDLYTSFMCVEAWGCPNFARALVEISSMTDFKETIKVATPNIEGKGHMIDTVRVEYEWKPPRCSCCKVFGHKDNQCPKVIVIEAVKEPNMVDGIKLSEDGF